MSASEERYEADIALESGDLSRIKLMGLRRVGGPPLWGLLGLLLLVPATLLTGAAAIMLPPIAAGVFLVVMVYGTPVLHSMRPLDESQRRFRMSVDSEGFEITNDRGTRGLKWKAIAGVAEVETAFLLLTTPKPIWIPKRQIDAEMQTFLRKRSQTKEVRRAPRRPSPVDQADKLQPSS